MIKTKEIYKSLYKKLKELDFYEYTIITTNDIDSNYSQEKLEKESPETSRKRRQRFRDEMIFTNLSYSFYLWQMGASSSTAMILWKIPCDEKDRDEEKLIRCISRSSQELPTFGNRKDFSEFHQKYKDVMGGSVPSSMLKYMYKDLTKDASKSLDIELDKRILNYCLSKGDKDLWPDLRAANSGASNRYDIFFLLQRNLLKKYPVLNHIEEMKKII